MRTRFSLIKIKEKCLIRLAPLNRIRMAGLKMKISSINFVREVVFKDMATWEASNPFSKIFSGLVGRVPINKAFLSKTTF